jgi:hypothetical protein
MIKNTSYSLDLSLFQVTASMYVTSSYKKELLINLFMSHHDIFQNIFKESHNVVGNT